VASKIAEVNIKGFNIGELHEEVFVSVRISFRPGGRAVYHRLASGGSGLLRRENIIRMRDHVQQRYSHCDECGCRKQSGRLPIIVRAGQTSCTKASAMTTTAKSAACQPDSPECRGKNCGPCDPPTVAAMASRRELQRERVPAFRFDHVDRTDGQDRPLTFFDSHLRKSRSARAGRLSSEFGVSDSKHRTVTDGL